MNRFPAALPVALLALWLMPGCESIGVTGKGTPTPSGVPATSPGPGGDADTDTDSDADSDADTDTDGPQPTPSEFLDCAANYNTPAPGGSGLDPCVTGIISCGQTIFGTSSGGSNAYDSHASNQAAGDFGGPFSQCAGSASQTDRLAHQERVYLLVPPPGTGTVSARLRTCTESWLFVHRISNGCPPMDEPLSACSYATEGTFYDQSDDFLIGPSGLMYLVIEGNDNDGGNYQLTVECS